MRNRAGEFSMPQILIIASLLATGDTQRRRRIAQRLDLTLQRLGHLVKQRLNLPAILPPKLRLYLGSGEHGIVSAGPRGFFDFTWSFVCLTSELSGWG